MCVCVFFFHNSYESFAYAGKRFEIRQRKAGSRDLLATRDDAHQLDIYIDACKFATSPRREKQVDVGMIKC